jgi:hypothetical protein
VQLTRGEVFAAELLKERLAYLVERGIAVHSGNSAYPLDSGDPNR